MDCFSYCRKMLMITIALLLVLTPALSPTAAGDDSVVIAIYNDTAKPLGGAWDEGLTAIKNMLDQYGYLHEDITPDQLNTSTSLIQQYRAIIFGGGWAGGYNTYITAQGFENIRQFISAGGGYFGICAGAYLATDVVKWRTNWSSPAEAYPYHLNLFNGLGIGPLLSIIAWDEPTGCPSVITEGAAVTRISLNNKRFPVLDAEMDILYYGGPAFLSWPGSLQKPDITVVARYQLSKEDMGPRLSTAPAMVLFPYGNGKVFLTGPHPEVMFDNCRLYYGAEGWLLMDTMIQELLN